MSEPDRYEEKVREVLRAIRYQPNEGDVPLVAAALRAVEAETLERAAQIADESREDGRCIAFAIRALASPAAAPAAEPSEPAAPTSTSDPYQCPATMEDEGLTYRCAFTRNHPGPHNDNGMAEWEDARAATTQGEGKT